MPDLTYGNIPSLGDTTLGSSTVSASAGSSGVLPYLALGAGIGDVFSLHYQLKAQQDLLDAHNRQLRRREELQKEIGDIASEKHARRVRTLLGNLRAKLSARGQDLGGKVLRQVQDDIIREANRDIDIIRNNYLRRVYKFQEQSLGLLSERARLTSGVRGKSIEHIFNETFGAVKNVSKIKDLIDA